MNHVPHPRWQRTLWISFIAQMMTSVGFSAVFPFFSLYVAELESTMGLSVELLAGLVFSVQGVTMMIFGPIWGMLADRMGRKLMVERAMFGGAVLMALMGFVRSAEELILLRALQGAVTGTIAAVYALVAGQAPREQSGYAMGLLQVANGTGVALGPLIGGAVADMFGYREAFYITGVLLFISGMLVLLGIEDDRGSLRKAKQAAGGWLAQWKGIFQRPGVRLTYALRALTSLGQTLFLPFVPLFLVSIMGSGGQINTFTGVVIGVASATTTVSAIYFGRLGDRVGHRRIVIACTLAAAVFFLPQTLVTQGWQLLVLQALVGVALGGVIPAVTALLALYTPPGEEGMVYGLDNSIIAGARAAAPLIGSAVVAAFGLRATFATASVLFAGMFVLALTALPELQPRGKPETPEAAA